jgi:FkbM family methyltransferase
VTGTGPRRIRAGAVAFAVADDQPTFWDRVEAGRWEPATLATLRRLIGPATTILDIGAWTGILSLYGVACGATRAVAVEADPAALAQLRRNLAANPDLAGRIEIVARAAAPHPGPVRLGARRKPGDSMSSVALADSPGAWTAEAVTPAELAALAGEGGPLLISLDIEGGEYALLPAMAPLLGRPGSALLVSCHRAILRAAAGPVAEAAAERAHAALAGLRASPVGAPGPPPAWGDRDATERCDTWLFERI